MCGEIMKSIEIVFFILVIAVSSFHIGVWLAFLGWQNRSHCKLLRGEVPIWGLIAANALLVVGALYVGP